MKGIASVEQHKCPVCAKDFDTGSVLFNRRVQATLDPKTVTGWGLCPECQKLYDAGYVALVGADEKKSSLLSNGNMMPDGAWRTGKIAHLRFEAFDQIFNISGVDRDGKRHPLMFVQDAVIEMLQAKAAKEAA